MTVVSDVFGPRNNYRQVLADELIDQTRDMVEELVGQRAKSGLSPAEMATEMQVPIEVVEEFEQYGSDPRLSDVARYALAINARVTISVENGAAWAKEQLANDRFCATLVGKYRSPAVLGVSGNVVEDARHWARVLQQG